MKMSRAEIVMNASDNWPEYSGFFCPDGALRDVCIRDTRTEDWVLASQFIGSQGYPLRFIGEWGDRSFPGDVQRLFPISADEGRPVLGIDVGGVLFNCHFFDPSWIEFDLDPAEVNEPAKLDAVLGFLRGLAASVGKEAILTLEGDVEAIYFRAAPNGQNVEYLRYLD